MPSDTTSSRCIQVIMFTDIVGYSLLMSENEEEGLKLLDVNRSIHNTCINRFNGVLRKELGDGVLASFNTALDAINCAMDILKESSHTDHLKLRIGIHLGEVVIQDNDLIGDGVNIAFRIQEVAKSGEILVSESVYKSLHNRKEFEFRGLGEKKLKNISNKIKLYTCRTSDQTQKRTKKDKTSKSRILIGVFLLSVVFLTWIFYPFTSSSGEDSRITIAVLPFENLGHSDDNLLSQGVTEDICYALSQNGEFLVIDYKATRLLGGNITLDEIKDRFKAEYILTGTYQGENNNARITSSLIETNSGAVSWTNHYETELSSILKLRSEVARNISNSLGMDLIDDETETLRNTKQIDPEAYNFVQLGKLFYRKESVADLDIALDHFKNAIHIDSSYALAWGWLGSTYSMQMDWQEDILQDHYKDSTRWAAEKAIEIDEFESMGYKALGMYYLDIDEYDQGIKYFVEAAKRDPSNTDIFDNLGFLNLLKGNIVKSHYFSLRASELDNQSLNAYGLLFRTYSIIHDFSSAIHTIDQALIVDKDDPYFILSPAMLSSLKVMALTESGQENKAKNILERIEPELKNEGKERLAAIYFLLKNCGSAIKYSAKGVLYAQCLYTTGNPEEGTKILDSLRNSFNLLPDLQKAALLNLEGNSIESANTLKRSVKELFLDPYKFSAYDRQLGWNEKSEYEQVFSSIEGLRKQAKDSIELMKNEDWRWILNEY